MNKICVLDTFDPGDAWPVGNHEKWRDRDDDSTFVSLRREDDGWYTDADPTEVVVDRDPDEDGQPVYKTYCHIVIPMPGDAERGYYFDYDARAGCWVFDGTDYGPIVVPPPDPVPGAVGWTCRCADVAPRSFRRTADGVWIEVEIDFKPDFSAVPLFSVYAPENLTRESDDVVCEVADHPLRHVGAFEDAPVELEAGTILEAIAEVDRRWPVTDDWLARIKLAESPEVTVGPERRREMLREILESGEARFETEFTQMADDAGWDEDHVAILRRVIDRAAAEVMARIEVDDLVLSAAHRWLTSDESDVWMDAFLKARGRLVAFLVDAFDRIEELEGRMARGEPLTDYEEEA